MAIIKNNRRVMIKVSGEALAGELPLSYNREFAELLGNELYGLINEGIGVCVVTGAGNIWRGARSDSRVKRAGSDYMGMLATAMNAVYLADCFSSLKNRVDTAIVSPSEISGVSEKFLRSKALEDMSGGKALIFAYGTGQPYFSTDTSAALYASQLEADLILSLKFGIDGVYTKDPLKYPEEAVFIEQITYGEIIANENINFMDKSAACILNESGIKTVVLRFDKGSMKKAVSGEKIGTLCVKQ